MAKKAGKYKGRKPALSPQQVAEIKRRILAGESKAALAREFGVTRPTVYRALKNT
nr:helix-turn-helix domain-containing protein [Corynebacterium parakroppenstedtii]